MSNTFDKPSDALAQIPKGSLFRLKQSSGGRPIELATPSGGLDWDENTFLKAKADKVLPDGRYIIKPIVNGKVSSKRVNLDLSFSEESLQVEGGGGMVDQGMGTANPSYLQESVVGALVQSYKDEREEVWSLRDQVDELKEKVQELELENAKLRHDSESAQYNESITATLNRAFANFLQGPGGAIMATRLLGSGQGSLMDDALKQASSS